MNGAEKYKIKWNECHWKSDSGLEYELGEFYQVRKY